MTPTKLLLGQIAIVFALVVGGVWAATQWAAAMLGYQARLGPAWFELAVLYAEREDPPQRSFIDTLAGMLATNHLGSAEGPQVHPVVAESARKLLSKSENERSDVLSTALSYLVLYRDPRIAAVAADDLVGTDERQRRFRDPFPGSLASAPPPRCAGSRGIRAR